MLNNVIRVRSDGDPKTGMEPSTMIDPGSFLVSDPHETIHTPFTNATGNVTAGVWECSPCKEHYERYGVDEFCTIISGSVTPARLCGTNANELAVETLPDTSVAAYLTV